MLAIYTEPLTSRWQKSLAETAIEIGYEAYPDRNSIKVWHPAQIQSIDTNVNFTNGWVIRRLWIGFGKYALAILPKRMYLDDNLHAINKREKDIVDLHNKPITSFANRLSEIKTLRSKLLSSENPVFISSVKLESVETKLDQCGKYVSGNGVFDFSTKLSAVHESGEFNRVPNNLKLVIVPDVNVSENTVKSYRQNIINGMQSRGAKIAVYVPSIRKLEDRIKEFDSGDQPTSTLVPVLIILESNTQSPSQKMQNMMEGLDRSHIPWRRAYATDDRTWGIRDQLGSILHAAGGLSHAIRSNIGTMPWSIGIDISNRNDFSRACSTLISPEGELVGAWIHDQNRNEELNPHVLRSLIKSAVSTISHSDRADGMVIIRDGRLFENENEDFYLKGLGGPATLVELRKYGNPPLLVGQEENPPSTASVGWLPIQNGVSIGFLVTLPQRTNNDFDFVFKVCMKQEWDNLQIGPSKLAQILTTLTKAPGLGLHPRKLPSPIYWADGIAGASETDLRFRGQKVIALDRT